MNPLMAEMLAREKTQRYEKEIGKRELIKKAKIHRPQRLNLLAPLKKLSANFRTRRKKRPYFQQAQKVPGATD